MKWILLILNKKLGFEVGVFNSGVVLYVRQESGWCPALDPRGTSFLFFFIKKNKIK
jgi:hypothetical protein